MTKKILSILLFLTMASCSNGPAKNRGVAAAETDENGRPAELEALFQTKIASPDDMSAYINRIMAIYYRAHKYTLDFDNELALRILKKPVDGFIQPMTDSEPYKKLLVMRELQFNLHEKITYMYGRALEQAYSATANADEKAKAHLLMANLFQGIRNVWSGKPEGRLAMVDLFTEMKTMRELVLANTASTLSPTEKAQAAFLNKAPISYYQAFKNQQAVLKEAAAAEVLKEDVEFNELYNNLQFERAPNAASIVPGSGSSGTISGGNFPRGTWALTYDDGPDGARTPRVLSMLKSNGVKATFFWLAQNAKKNAGVVTAAKNDGHTLANHSYSHADLSKKSSNLQKEVVDSTAVEKGLYGSAPKYFRCPYGSCVFNKTATSAATRKLIADQGMIHVLWNVDSNDWKADTPDVIFKRTKDQINNLPAGIVLFHDIHDRSVSASTRLVQEVLNAKNSGKRMVTIDAIVSEINSK